jgi:hypothetical protein
MPSAKICINLHDFTARVKLAWGIPKDGKEKGRRKNRHPIPFAQKMSSRTLSDQTE